MYLLVLVSTYIYTFNSTNNKQYKGDIMCKCGNSGSNGIDSIVTLINEMNKKGYDMVDMKVTPNTTGSDEADEYLEVSTIDILIEKVLTSHIEKGTLPSLEEANVIKILHDINMESFYAGGEDE